jgi:hypothetical protein
VAGWVDLAADSVARAGFPVADSVVALAAVPVVGRAAADFPVAASLVVAFRAAECPAAAVSRVVDSVVGGR